MLQGHNSDVSQDAIEPINVAEGSAPVSMRLSLEIADPEVIAELSRYPSAAERERFALAALRVGVLAARTASGSLDAEMIQTAGERLVRDVRHLLLKEGSDLTTTIAQTLHGYLDPELGTLPQRVRALVEKGGELDRLLDAHVGSNDSKIAQTLAQSLGENSPIFKLLAPDEADSVIVHLRQHVADALTEQRQIILKEFSLDHRESALSRLVDELGQKQDELCKDVGGQTRDLLKELSLDHPDSALSRLVGRVETAQRTLTREFSLDEDTSALSRLSRIIEDSRKQIDKHLTLDNDTSALSRLRREIKNVMSEQAEKSAVFQADVKASIAALSAQRAEAEKGVQHGHDFEGALGSVLSKLAQRCADPFQETGNTTGTIRNCKVGDFVVELGPDSQSPGARIVWEAKEDKSYDLKKALDEIERGRKNRAAQIGIFVFSSKTAPQGLETFSRYGHSFVLVWDRDDSASDILLKAAYSSARALVQAEKRAEHDDAEAVNEVERASRAVEKQIQYLDEFEKSAGAIESHAHKVADRARKMRKELIRQVAILDERVSDLRHNG
jgi:hypothetical protein